MQAAVFDMDGVLIDSEPLWRRAERAAFARVGLDLSDSDCRQTMGLRSDEVVDLWYRRRPWSGVGLDEVVRDMEGRVANLVRSEGRPLPGVECAIDELRRAGIRLALASSSDRELIRVVLATLGLEDSFEVVCSAVDEDRGKPDPAVYLSAIRGLGVAAAECVAFEDSVAGVASAASAGLRVIAVPAANQFDDAGFEAADLKLRSLEEFSVEVLSSL
jgi:sugar-phosphatase